MNAFNPSPLRKFPRWRDATPGLAAWGSDAHVDIQRRYLSRPVWSVTVEEALIIAAALEAAEAVYGGPHEWRGE